MAKKHDGRRNVKAKTSKRYPRPGRSFNYLNGDDRKWAKENHFDVAEHCVGVKDGKRFSGSDDTKLKCGDGRSGFSTRRVNHDEVKMEVGMGGQFKKKRSTLIRPKSARCSASRRARRIDGSKCGLISQFEIELTTHDPIEVVKQAKAANKLKRAKNRNKRAARGYKKSQKATTTKVKI